MSEADRPGEATSRKRSRLQEELAELERVLDGIELDPERKSMLRAAGYRTCIGIAWAASKQQAAPAFPPSAGTALLGLPPAPPALPAPAPPAPAMPPAPGAPPVPSTPEGMAPPGAIPLPQAAGAWAKQLAERLSNKQLRQEEYSSLCKLMQLQKGQYPSPDDCLLLTEIEAYNIACAQPRPCAQPRRRWR